MNLFLRLAAWMFLCAVVLTLAWVLLKAVAR